MVSTEGMKAKSMLILALFSITSLMYAKDAAKTAGSPEKAVEMPTGVSKVRVDNDTRHNLKVGIESKEKLAKSGEMVRPVQFNPIPAEAVDMNYSKEGSLMGYKGGRFSVEIVNKMLGVQTAFWEGEFTGQNMEVSHLFEYRPVVQDPVVVTSTINMKMTVTYDDESGGMTIVFTAPDEENDY